MKTSIVALACIALLPGVGGAGVGCGAEGWKLALDAGLTTNPDVAARAHMGYVELGAMYSPGKDLDLAVGIVHNVRDGDISTTQATIGLTWPFR